MTSKQVCPVLCEFVGVQTHHGLTGEEAHVLVLMQRQYSLTSTPSS